MSALPTEHPPRWYLHSPGEAEMAGWIRSFHQPLCSICYCWRLPEHLLFCYPGSTIPVLFPPLQSQLLTWHHGSQVHLPHFSSLHSLPKTPPLLTVSTMTTFRPESIGFSPPDGKTLLRAFQQSCHTKISVLGISHRQYCKNTDRTPKINWKGFAITLEW